MAKKLTSTKARKILHDKEVHGHPLTEQQRKFFGAIAGGAKPYKAQIGTMLTSLPTNYMETLSEALGFPQKAVTKLVTGKYQTPSEALNITNPYLAFGTNAFLDPINFPLGASAKAAGALDNVYKINPFARRTPQFSKLPAKGEMIRHPFQNKMVPIEEVSGDVEWFYPKNVDDGGPGYTAARGSKEWKELSESGRFYLIRKEKGTHAMVDLITDVEQRKLSIPTSKLAKYRLESNIHGVPNWLMGYAKAPKKQDGGWLDKYDAPQAQNGIEAAEFRSKNAIDSSGRFFRYVPKGQNGQEITYTWDPSGPSNDYYMLKRTVTPYTRKRDIRKFTKAPTDPSQVDFISNYTNTSRSDRFSNPNPTSVPYQDEKHWNIDRFIIEPAFSNISSDLQNSQSTKKQMKQNVLADMYKYFMVQNQGDKKNAWKQAKQFMREEINPRISGSFYEGWLRGLMPLTGTGTGITDAINQQYMSQVNSMMKDATTGYGDYAARRYAQDPVPKSKYKKFGMDWLMNYKKLSRKEAKNYLKNSENFSEYTPSDTNGGWLDKYEEGGVLKQKTHDNYGIKPNVNNPDVSLPPGFVGMAYNTKGRNYSPAWGGQFAMGGSLPGSPGFMYARTINPAPDNGPYAKKTKASAQNGSNVNLIPRATGDLRGPKIDPRMLDNIAATQALFEEQNMPQPKQEFVGPAAPRTKETEAFRKKKLAEVAATNPNFQLNDQGELVKSGYARFMDKYGENLDKLAGGLGESAFAAFDRPSKLVQSLYTPNYTAKDALLGKPNDAGFLESIATDPTNIFGGGLLKGAARGLLPKIGAAVNADLNRQLGINMPAAMYKRSSLIKPLLGYIPKRDGGDIPVDPMGYWNADNVGNPVTIPSNVITMEGVDQPLLGISDTGDVQYMMPGEDYEFDGEYVTEYPVAKKGISVNKADAQPVKKLDQLLNFTNYNKPTKGGWLDKYE